MTAPKQYKMGELEKMSKNQMKKILKNTYGKSDAQVKLGHFNDPYRKLIIELQNEKYNHQNNNNNNNNNNSNNNSNHNNNSRNRKRKSKFVEHPGSDAFEGEKKRLERKKLEQKGKKALNKKDEKENKNNNNNEKLEEGGSDDSTNAQDGLGHGSCLEPEDDVEGFGKNIEYQHYWWVNIACKILQHVRKTQSKLEYFKNLYILVDRFHAEEKHNQKGATNALTKLCLEYCDIIRMDKSRIEAKHKELVDFLNDNKHLGNSQISEQTMNNKIVLTEKVSENQ
eukprot:274431_1